MVIPRVAKGVGKQKQPYTSKEDEICLHLYGRRYASKHQNC